MEIFYSRDHILNSKSEYIKNCINRLTVNEPELERKERERREEADDLIEKDKIEKFKKDILEGRRKRDEENKRIYRTPPPPPPEDHR